MGRTQNITPILATQMLGDAAELEPLVGALFAFGVETEAEARKALALLRLDPDDEAAIQRLLGYRAGRCYLRDFAGQVAPIQIDPPPWMLGELDTTPRGARPPRPRRASASARRPRMPPVRSRSTGRLPPCARPGRAGAPGRQPVSLATRWPATPDASQRR